ncbi:MAG: preprotein translocase subunit SecE [Candidatus Electronema aureum]|uniref:Protein translocase subunit SecE n=1 Tax=Candidatus Electronema aureum TaxID=2005002 RepID=A0A521G4R3_9BACT|nr:MAG: preprotein translocase subunit SecE [Candidatus Electronema aureum]
MIDKKKKSGGLDEGPAVLSPYSPAGIRQFFQEVTTEFKKIVWPDRKATFGISGFVILLTIILSVYLGTVDFVLGKLVSLVLQ